MRSTLITGACGFVGRNLVRILLADGVETLTLIDDLSAGIHPDRWLGAEAAENVDIHTWRYQLPTGAVITFVRADLRVFLAGQPHRHGPLQGCAFDDVYHLAANVGGRLALENTPLHIAENMAIDVAFYSWATQFPDLVERILYMSSSAIYPLSHQRHGSARPLREGLADEVGLGDTDGVYGWAKLTGEFLARTAAGKAGLHIACVRPFSGYGGDQDLTYPVPALAARVAAREDPLVVWGSGMQQRDFLHVDDLIEGMRRAIARISDGRAVNLGTGAGTTLNDVAAALSAHAGYSPRTVNDATKPTGAEVRVADIGAMVELLHWTPATDLATGMGRVLRSTAAARPAGAAAAVSRPC